MYLPSTFMALIATSSLINALPQTLTARDLCTVKVYIGDLSTASDGSGDGAVDNSNTGKTMCEVTTLAPGGLEEFLDEEDHCTQTAFNFASNGAEPNAVKDFTVSQKDATCTTLGDGCYPSIT